MSSETSTSPQEGLPPWQLFAVAGLVGATLVVFLARGQSPVAVILLSLIIFAAAGVGAAALRTFLPLTSTGSAQYAVQVLAGRTRAALEREKTLAFRSIKELEFDRAMGKVSDKDFDVMNARLRFRAGGLLQQLDAGAGYREQIEREIERRLGTRQPLAGAQPPAACASCGTANDEDARFCKQCGTGLRQA